tara:strand:+ start:1856 stop:2293 length:438 start_codon:yes stop_codon:yes gene_type:complete
MSQQSLAHKVYLVLADSYAVYLKTQNYHWNVTGPHFRHLHLLFEEQYTELADAIDTLAERLRTFDLKVEANFEAFAAATSISNADSAATASEMIQDLVESHELLRVTLSKAAEEAQNQGDLATEDLMVERLGEHEKALWMLKSSL